MTACEVYVTQALSSCPLIKSLLKGLNDAGCSFDIVRHVVCEPCNHDLAGGYDMKHNQVVLCSHKCTSQDKVSSVLAHELVHMYDQCVAKVDWTNPLHLACSEVRAASIAHCAGPLSSALNDGGSWSRLYQQHRECVKEKAARSVKAILRCPRKDAEEAVEKIFSKCYKDTEPVGRYKCSY